MKDLILQNAPTVASAMMRTDHCLRLKFPNGYGASVIDDGYGSEEGLYELAVLDTAGHVTSETSIANDVVGWLTRDDLLAMLQQIADLPA
ncbi:hypothetical protein [Streptomyces sp. NPDC048445]|uniref:hypothetical protein n=1 Tax=Streptomyces sp. NPDC048445 TaxID=3365553 RepID=UPI003712C3B2